MIPCAVELTDFLSHRTPDGAPVVFDFDGAVLWSVAGDNGAGKSAIFDAITWTLYGQHRGGTQDAKRLISHGAERCSAAFVFALDGERYRVERSVRRRGAAARAAMRWDEAAGRWEEIPGTSAESGFAGWRDELLGLSYEAFTQAVLLIQGGSDRLVATGARERFEILAQLIDLSAYRRLEERARERAHDARGRRDAHAAEIERLAAVDPEQRDLAQAELERRAAERAARRAAWEAHAAVVQGARAHAALGERLAAIEREIGAAEALAADAERIRAQAAEHAALTTARPRLEAGIAAIAAAAEAHAAAAAAGERVDAIDLAALERAEAGAQDASATARRAAALVGERAAALRRSLPALETALQRRLELLDAEEAAARAGDPALAASAIERAEALFAELRAACEAARQAERAGERTLAEASAAARDAEAALKRCRAGEREVVCARCGQEVPPEHRQAHLAHLEEEVAARRAARAEAEAALAPLDATRRDGERTLERAREIVGELERTHGRALDAAAAVARAGEAAAAAREAIGAWEDLGAAALADGDRAPIGAGQAPSAPVAAEADCAKVEPLRGDLRAVVAGGDRGQVEALRGDLRAASAAADREESERAQQAARAEEAARAAAERARAAREQRAEAGLRRERARQEAAAQERRAEIELAELPDAWAARARAGEADLLGALDERLAALAPAVERASALAAAETSLAGLRAARAEVAAQLDAVPGEHRVAVTAAEAELARRAQAFEQASARAQQAQAALRELDRRERELADRRDQLARAALQERLATRLAVLLGRQGVQGHLIVRAARGLERLANDTLRALTGGALELEISAEERRGRDEVVIAVRDYEAGGERTDASFLSGSEKFRVCVAMAAAIGTYASGRSALESLIIDEGFGSLDESSRDEMIEELQRLAQLLKRVIVVSHQGEFHDRARFPHGYRLRRTAGATEVERFV